MNAAELVFIDSLDINVSPDKRTIFIHSEDNLVTALKVRVYRIM